MIRAVDELTIREAKSSLRFPMNDVVAKFNRLYLDNPAAFAELLAWLGDTPFGEITLRFQGGKFCMVEQTRRVK